MKRILFPLVGLFMLLAAACGSDTTPVSANQPDDQAPSATETPGDAQQPSESEDPGMAERPPLESDEVVFVWSETGGCAMLGPNCARFEVRADGSVTTYRQTVDGWVEAATGQVTDRDLDGWIQAVVLIEGTDFTTRLGPGELTAAFDGTDQVLAAPFTGFEISSIEFEFDRNESLFVAAEALKTAAREAAPLELEAR